MIKINKILSHLCVSVFKNRFRSVRNLRTLLTITLFWFLTTHTTAQTTCHPITPTQWEHTPAVPGRPAAIKLYFTLSDGTFVDGLPIYKHPSTHQWTTPTDPTNETIYCLQTYKNFISYTLNQLSTQTPTSPQYPDQYNHFLRSINPFKSFLPLIPNQFE